MANSSLSLLSSQSRVEVPFIKVQIGNYTLGVYEESASKLGGRSSNNVLNLKYPNYVKDLTITKINGQVNKYELTLEYTITEFNDPNFFEKMFSSVSKSRAIIFSYGDMSMPYYIYRDEEALIQNVESDHTIASNRITYKVYAISSANLLTSVTSTFRRRVGVKPSDVIKELLKSETFGLLEVFYGMRNGLSINGVDLIPGNDLAKTLETKENISVLDYLKYLVNEMTPIDGDSILKGSIYLLKFSDDVTNELSGPYFQIVQTNKNVNTSEAYEIDIGYESKDIVKEFRIENNESYSIFYDYCNELEDTQYVKKYNARGELEEVYAPIVSSGNVGHRTKESDKSWWTKVTSFPVSASITLKGLLRPAMLVTNVRINIYYFGQKHINSGLYIVTKEVDKISESGFETQLNLVKIGGDSYE